MIIKILNLLISISSLLGFLVWDKIKLIFRIRSKEFNICSIIFSANRPLQLDTLLKSIVKNLDKKISIYVLYKVNSSRMNLSYDKLINSYAGWNQIYFIKEENSFKDSINNLLNLIEKHLKGTTQLLFFVDDQILYKSINLSNIKNLLENSFVASFRFGKNTKYSFILDKKQNIKQYRYKFKNDIYQWSPTFIRDELSYLFSFDSSTIPLDLFKIFTKNLIYKGPNSLETTMNYSKFLYKSLNLKISSLSLQSAVNLVITVSQKETINRGDFIDLDYFLNMFENGWRLELDKNIITNINSPHINFGGILIREGVIKNV